MTRRVHPEPPVATASSPSDGCPPTVTPRPILRLDTVTAAGPLPEIPGTGPLRLAAMAKPPAWVRRLTHGRPYGACYAETAEEIDLMEMALTERANPLFSQGAVHFRRYEAAMLAKFHRFEGTGCFAPGALIWSTHDGGMAFGRDGYPNGRRLPEPRERDAIPAGSWLLCTCKPAQGCHLRILAPFFARAGWDVRLYGEPLTGPG